MLWIDDSFSISFLIKAMYGELFFFFLLDHIPDKSSTNDKYTKYNCYNCHGIPPLPTSVSYLNICRKKRR